MRTEPGTLCDLVAASTTAADPRRPPSKRGAPTVTAPAALPETSSKATTDKPFHITHVAQRAVILVPNGKQVKEIRVTDLVTLFGIEGFGLHPTYKRRPLDGVWSVSYIKTGRRAGTGDTEEDALKDAARRVIADATYNGTTPEVALAKSVAKNNGVLVTLALDLIRRDGGMQPRASIDRQVVSEYAESQKRGAKFPPLRVVFDGENLWLADGFHRLEAYLEAGVSDAECEVNPGTQQDAQWYSYSCNLTHGLQRSNADKRQAVRAALEHPKASGLSDRQIAEHCGVSHNMISEYRESIQPTVIGGQSTLRTGRDGRTIDTARIGKSGPPAASETVFESSERERKENGIRVWVKTTAGPITPVVPVSQTLTTDDLKTIAVPPANEQPPQTDDQSPDRHMNDVPGPALETAKKVTPDKPKPALARGAALAAEIETEIEALKSGKINGSQATALLKEARRQVADMANDIKRDKEAFKAARKTAGSLPTFAEPVPEAPIRALVNELVDLATLIGTRRDDLVRAGLDDDGVIDDLAAVNAKLVALLQRVTASAPAGPAEARK